MDSSPPRDPQQWLDPLPWHIYTDRQGEHTSFHNYWKQVGQGKIVASPLTAFESPTQAMHEVAHLICCQDEHVLSPTWGLPMAADPYEPLTPAHALCELTVFYVEVLILSHLEQWQPTPGARLKTQLILNTYAFGSGYKLDARERKQAMKYIMHKFPTIESAWLELQRKQQLIINTLM